MKKMFFALSVCAGMNATAAVSESWDLATVRRQTDRAADWQTLAVRETCSDFWREADGRAARTFTDCLPAAFFDEGTCYRFSVEPYGFYGKVGARIFAEWTAPKKDAVDPLCVLDSDLPVLQGGEKFLLPQCVQDLPPQTPLRAIVDAESDHGANESLSFRIQGYPVKEVVNGYALRRMARFLNRKSQRRYRLKFADTYYGELNHYGMYWLKWADVRRCRY